MRPIYRRDRRYGALQKHHHHPLNHRVLLSPRLICHTRAFFEITAGAKHLITPPVTIRQLRSSGLATISTNKRSSSLAIMVLIAFAAFERSNTNRSIRAAGRSSRHFGNCPIGGRNRRLRAKGLDRRSTPGIAESVLNGALEGAPPFVAKCDIPWHITTNG